jgi:hypothetical protein
VSSVTSRIDGRLGLASIAFGARSCTPPQAPTRIAAAKAKGRLASPQPLERV